jgi:hypothetical protein
MSPRAAFRQKKKKKKLSAQAQGSDRGDDDARGKWRRRKRKGGHRADVSRARFSTGDAGTRRELGPAVDPDTYIYSAHGIRSRADDPVGVSVNHLERDLFTYYDRCSRAGILRARTKELRIGAATSSSIWKYSWVNVLSQQLTSTS